MVLFNIIVVDQHRYTAEYKHHSNYVSKLCRIDFQFEFIIIILFIKVMVFYVLIIHSSLAVAAVGLMVAPMTSILTPIV